MRRPAPATCSRRCASVAMQKQKIAALQFRSDRHRCVRDAPLYARCCGDRRCAGRHPRPARGGAQAWLCKNKRSPRFNSDLIDIDASEMRRYTPDVAVIADAQAGTRDLLAAVRKRGYAKTKDRRASIPI